MTRRKRSLLVTVIGSGIAAGAVLAGCSPLPGDSFDPVYLKHGAGTESQPTQTPARPEVSPPSAAPESRPAGSKAAPNVAKATGAREWVGRYRDSRGDGDVMFSLVQGESSVSGTWKLRTGGGGSISGVLEASGRRFRLRMQNTAPECPGAFEGWAEIGETTLVAAYHGSDCEGPVADGWLDLRVK